MCLECWEPHVYNHLIWNDRSFDFKIQYEYSSLKYINLFCVSADESDDSQDTVEQILKCIIENEGKDLLLLCCSVVVVVALLSC